MSEGSGVAIESSAVWAPGVGSSYSNGWRQLKKYILELFLITVIGIVIGAALGLFHCYG